MDLGDIDFNALASKASDMVTSDSTPATTEPVVTPVTPVTPVVGSQPTVVDPASTQSAATQTPANSGTVSPAEEKISVDFGNGKVEQLTKAEIAAKLLEAERSGLRQADYTKKTTEVARQREEALKVWNEVQAHREKVQRAEFLLNNPQAMLEEAQRRVAASQPIDPTQPMTVAQGLELVKAVQTEFAALKEAKAKDLEAANIAAQQMVEDRLAVANYAESINGKLTQVYTAHPVLKALPEMEQVIRYRVAQLEPTTIDETLQAFERVAAEVARPFETAINTKQQEAEAARAKLVSQGTEPPGGVAPQVAKPDFKTKDGRDLDWNKLKEQALGL